MHISNFRAIHSFNIQSNAIRRQDVLKLNEDSNDNFEKYRKASNISRTLVGNKIVDV